METCGIVATGQDSATPNPPDSKPLVEIPLYFLIRSGLASKKQPRAAQHKGSTDRAGPQIRTSPVPETFLTTEAPSITTHRATETIGKLWDDCAARDYPWLPKDRRSSGRYRRQLSLLGTHMHSEQGCSVAARLRLREPARAAIPSITDLTVAGLVHTDIVYWMNGQGSKRRGKAVFGLGARGRRISEAR
jgi:hypothetical protein